MFYAQLAFASLQMIGRTYVIEFQGKTFGGRSAEELVETEQSFE